MNANRELDIYICGTHCGVLREDLHGALSFAYDPDYAGVPLSMSMPLGLPAYGNRVVRPYLMGLLPDDAATRQAIGAAYGVSAENPFRLLEIIGLDCPGGVQVCHGDLPTAAGDELVPLAETQVAARLASIRQDAANAWVGDLAGEGHWSLGGCQAKLGLREQDGQWFECRGSAATTHILKPGVEGMRHQALVEYLCMRVARRLGLPVAEVEYRRFAEEPAIVVTRYDRATSPNGQVARIHQEDLCQALAVVPTRKYAEQGGPTTPQVIRLLGTTGHNARENVYLFVLYLFFNYLIGATDAHAKNHSVVFAAPGDIRLAPLYDVASIAPYMSLAPRQRKPLQAALSIGGENRFGLVAAPEVQNMVAASAELLCERFHAMAGLLPDAIDAEIDAARAEGLDGTDEVGPKLSREVRAHCLRTLERL